MGWMIFGFVTGIGIETFVRVCSTYERTEPRPERRCPSILPVVRVPRRICGAQEVKKGVVYGLHKARGSSHTWQGD